MPNLENMAFLRHVPYLPGQSIAMDTCCLVCICNDSQGSSQSRMRSDMSKQHRIAMTPDALFVCMHLMYASETMHMLTAQVCSSKRLTLSYVKHIMLHCMLAPNDLRQACICPTCVRL